MTELENHFQRMGINVPRIILPKKEIDMQKWGVVACDQYTSEREYWTKVGDIVGKHPSTLNLIFPEVYLEDKNKSERIASIHKTMNSYLDQKILTELDPGFLLVERATPHSPPRHGLLVALDLERYDYSQDSQSLIRATEGTIVERIPPRKEIREDAVLELPHIMVLVDDPNKQVIEPLVAAKERLPKLYDFPLMMGSGHIKGYRVAGQKLLGSVLKGLESLADPQYFRNRYHTDKGLLLYAMGDGNHSLATAKAVWEDIKKNSDSSSSIMEHPARWALVELLNIYDQGIVFEGIHRLLFHTDIPHFFYQASEKAGFDLIHLSNIQQMHQEMEIQGSEHKMGFSYQGHYGLFVAKNPNATIAAATMQPFLDEYIKQNPTTHMDYIHGSDVTNKLSQEEGNLGIYLPTLNKSDFFKTVIHDGALPRKTFSMGEADEKRFYLEARKISP